MSWLLKYNFMEAKYEWDNNMSAWGCFLELWIIKAAQFAREKTASNVYWPSEQILCNKFSTDT